MARRLTNKWMQGKLNNFGAKYDYQENITKKAELISNMGKELKGIEGPEAKIHINSFRTRLKKYQIWKRPAMIAYMDSGSKNHLHTWQTSNRNKQMPTRSRRNRLNDQRKDHIDLTLSKEPLQTTHDLPTYDVENTNGTNKGRELRLANKPRIVPQGTDRMFQKNQRHRRATWHILNESKSNWKT